MFVQFFVSIQGALLSNFDSNKKNQFFVVFRFVFATIDFHVLSTCFLIHPSPSFYAYYENPRFPAMSHSIHSGTRITVVVCRKPRVIKRKLPTASIHCREIGRYEIGFH